MKTNPESMQGEKWMLIVNPRAGNGYLGREWDRISALLERAEINHESVFTTGRFHAEELAADAVDRGCHLFIVAGGDGTLNEVVNGLFRRRGIRAVQPTLAIIPAGTGNDWCRLYGIPPDPESAIHLLQQAKTKVQDIGKVCFDQNGKRTERYFANVAGIGFDAAVARRVCKQKEAGKSGKLTYLMNLFSALLSYRSTRTGILIREQANDAGRHISTALFSLCVGIGRYNGGGMMQLPHAIPDDGLLDITLIQKMSKLTILANVKNLYDGSFLKLKKVRTFRGISVSLQSNPPVFLEVDGEPAGQSPFEFTILPLALQIVTG
jgi:YegS/Rv2252/BmrU family lipid kinase